MTSRTLILAALWAPLVLSGCSARAPAEASPRLVTLATFEGEIDPDAGTLVVRTTSPTGTSTAPSAALVIPTGAGTITITNAGTPSPNVDGTGACAGQKVLSAPVRITLGYPSPGFAGGLYAELLTLSGTGAESCDNATPPPGSGLDTSKGLWSYGTVRPGATTSDQTWQFKWTAGQKTIFTGRIVGVPGTAIDVSSAKPACPPYWDAVIAYTRAVASGADRIAYAVRNTTSIALLDLDGGSQGTLTAPEAVTSLASYIGTTADDDILWFTTNGYIGAVYRGTVYHAPSGDGTTMWVTVDPTTTNRAWFISRSGNWVRSATFNTATPAVTPSAWFYPGGTPSAIAIAPARSPSPGNWLYVASQSSNYIAAYNLNQQYVETLPWTDSVCSAPATLLAGPDGKLWYANCAWSSPGCQYCNYDPSTNAFHRIPIATSAIGSGASGIGRCHHRQWQRCLGACPLHRRCSRREPGHAAGRGGNGRLRNDDDVFREPCGRGNPRLWRHGDPAVVRRKPGRLGPPRLPLVDRLPEHLPDATAVIPGRVRSVVPVRE